MDAVDAKTFAGKITEIFSGIKRKKIHRGVRKSEKHDLVLY
jgi:hypothetical protein